MLTLHADLLAAQRSRTATPVLTLTARHAEAGQYLPRFQFAAGDATSEEFHAAATTIAGTHIRAVIDAGRLFRYRVTAPTPASDFFGAGIQVNATVGTAGCAVATSGTEVLLFCVNAAGTGILEHRSADDGATFGAPTTLFTEAAAVTYIAAVSKADGAVMLVWNTGAVGAGTGATLRCARRSSGLVWGAAVSSALSMGDCFGVAVATPTTGTAFQAAVTGRTTTALAPRLWALTLTDAVPPVWGTAIVLETAESGLVDKYEYHQPTLLNAGDRLRMTYNRIFLGNVSRHETVLTALPGPAYSVTDRRWREPTLIRSTAATQFGLHIAGPGNGYLWITGSNSIWSAPYPSPTRDLSADLLALTADWKPDGGSLTLALDNSAGQYNDLSDDSLDDALSLGSEIVVALGYRTASGDRTAQPLPLYRVERLDRLYAEGKSTVQVTAREAFRWLERWHNPSQILIAAGVDSLSEVLAQVAARAGYPLADPTSALAARTPALTINPGESGRSAIARIIGRVPSRLYERQGTLTVRDLADTDAPTYIYGPSDYPAESALYSPVAYYKMGEPSGQALDSTINANHATVTLGGGTRAAPPLNAGGDGCIDFDGDTTKAQVAAATPINNIWDSGGAVAAIINPRSAGEGSVARMYDKHEQYIALQDLSAGALRLRFQYLFTGTDAGWNTTGRPLIVGNKTLIALSYNAGSVANNPTLYLYDLVTKTLAALTVGSGLTPTSTPTGTRETDAPNPLIIGNESGNSRGFDGPIDEVALYPTTITLAQFEALAATAETTGHLIARLTDQHRLPQHNAFTVYGADRSDVAHDTAGQWKSGPAPTHAYDRTNATNAQVTEHAAAMLDRAQAQERGELLPALPNVGQELYDVIAVNNPTLGLAAAHRRITAIRIDHRRGDAAGSPRFTQTLTLEDI